MRASRRSSSSMESRYFSTASSWALAYSSFLRLSSALVTCFLPLTARIVVPSRQSVCASISRISRHARTKIRNICFRSFLCFLRKSAIVRKSGHSRFSRNHSSMFRRHSRISRLEERIRLR